MKNKGRPRLNDYAQIREHYKKILAYGLLEEDRRISQQEAADILEISLATLKRALSKKERRK